MDHRSSTDTGGRQPTHTPYTHTRGHTYGHAYDYDSISHAQEI